jgi:hypothetical protein
MTSPTAHAAHPTHAVIVRHENAELLELPGAAFRLLVATQPPTAPWAPTASASAQALTAPIPTSTPDAGSCST